MSDDTKVPNLTVVPINTSSGEGNEDPLNFHCCDVTKLTHQFELFDEQPVDIVKNTEGETLFKLKDVCVAINYDLTNIGNAAKLISGEYKVKIPVYSASQNRNVETWYTSEFGVYEFLFRTSSPKAKRFQKWAFDIIRKIRQTGGYNLQQQAQPSTDLAAICATILATIQAESNKIISIVQAQTVVIQEEGKTTRALIDAHYGTINNLVGVVSNNQVEQIRQQRIDDFIVHSVAAKQQIITINKSKLTIRQFVDEIGKNCNCLKVSHAMRKLGYKNSYTKGSCSFYVEDLQEFYQNNISMFQ